MCVSQCAVMKRVTQPLSLRTSSSEPGSFPRPPLPPWHTTVRFFGWPSAWKRLTSANQKPTTGRLPAMPTNESVSPSATRATASANEQNFGHTPAGGAHAG